MSVIESVERHRSRIRNVAHADAAVVRCARRHFVERYLPGAVTYNLSEYPAPSSIAPTEYDHELLGLLAEGGVELIELHEEWNDVLRRFGGDKYTSYDPDGLRAFVDLVHSLGMQIIGYMSTGFFERSDPDLREEWLRYPDTLPNLYYEYVHCSPASPEWRAYLLPRLERMLDEYGFDGLYNDCGYDWMIHEARKRFGFRLEKVEPSDLVLPYDPAFEDMLGHVMTMTHARGGISKVHLAWDLAPTAYAKVYDYLWVGEHVTTGERLRERTGSHEPYVVPCPDNHRQTRGWPDDVYLNSIPYMQFPLRVDGRPVTGERALVDGVGYREPIDDDHWGLYFRRVHEHYVQHPDGPHCYGSWDGIEGIDGPVGARDRWLEYLGLYKPMVTANTRCWIDIQESSLFDGAPLGHGTAATLFANESLYLVIANFRDAPLELATTDGWTDRRTGASGRRWTLPARELAFLELADDPQPAA